MKYPRLFSLSFAVFLGLVLYACTPNQEPGDPAPASHDAFKTRMLTHYADQLIIPAYSELTTRLSTLEAQIIPFLEQPTAAKLAQILPAYQAAYLSYQATDAAYFGPASALLFNNYLNTFPTVPSKIEQAIATGRYAFDQPVVSDSIQGFPALDYLLFAPDAVTKFTGPQATARKQYVRDVLARMKSLTANTLSQWQGDYRTVFVNSLRTDVGSSMGALINQFAYEMDRMKGPRIGWPFGKLSNNRVFADKSEGYYSGLTKDLALANLISLKNYFAGGQGDGIADYLILLKKEAVATQVLAQFDVAIGALQAIHQPMAESFSKNPAQVEEAYRQVQKLLTLLKTDVASATSVQITYQDNDGD